MSFTHTKNICGLFKYKGEISCACKSFFFQLFLTDNFQLVVPQTTQEATISMGSEFFVPCYLSPEICATAMQIKWFKDTDCVCVYKKRHVTEGRAYKDRVSLVTHELERGNVSLHLNNFSVSDAGDYHCQINSRYGTKEITVGGEYSTSPFTSAQGPNYLSFVRIKLNEITQSL